MAKTLFEAYKNRLNVADAVYGKMHGGEKMNGNRKLVTAKCLENINRFMNEAFDNSVGTQRSDMGMFKKFAMNLTTVALPNLIAHDLVIVHPMASMSGYINYIQYSYASNKGETTQGQRISDPFGFGNVDTDYTGMAVTEALTVRDGKVDFAWTPVLPHSVSYQVTDADGVAGEWVVIEEDKDETGKGLGTFTAPEVAEGSTARVKYRYNNVVIPQNDIPMVKAEMKSIPLVAKARRIAIYFSQIAAYQAKTDYGVDLGDQLAEKATGELAYEIDTEITNKLLEVAEKHVAGEIAAWSKTVPVGISKAEHYDGFLEILDIARDKIYSATKRFAPNYMVCASDVLNVVSLMKAWKPAPATGSINGPYLAGTLNGLKVYVTPNFATGKYIVGVNGNDMMSSALVYAPYMAIVPTQLLGYADGGMSQGWSTLYDLAELNPMLVVAGTVTQ